MRHVPAGGTLLDFGCGTGIDAQEYVRRGYRVLAYDNSAGMVAELERRCGNEIAAGKVLPCARDYSAFLRKWPEWPKPHAVVANFAVLNSIGNLPPLFDALAERLAPPGWFIGSILNPIHWTKLKEPRLWLRRLRARDRAWVYLTEPYLSYLHCVDNLRRASRQFQLAGRANAGGLVRYDELLPIQKQLWLGKEHSRAGRWARFVWSTPVHKILGHFVFLVLRRDG
jgi:SAM-dependent methyltransferase